MTYQEFVNAYFGYDGTHTSIDVLDLSDEDNDTLSAEYQRYLAQKNNEEE